MRPADRYIFAIKLLNTKNKKTGRSCFIFGLKKTTKQITDKTEESLVKESKQNWLEHAPSLDAGPLLGF